GQTVALFGEDQLREHIDRALAIHNRALAEAIADFARVTDERQLPYGLGDDMEMQELDQMGSPDVQKTAPAGVLGLPLRFFGIAVQWNRHFMLNTTVGELLARLDAAASADVRNVTRQLRRALMLPTNTPGYFDILQSKLTYDIRALLNADGQPVPIGPNAETFNGATHTHYRAEAALSDAGLTGTLDTVLEHGVSGGMAIYINRAQEAAVRGFTASFTPYVDARINPSSTDRTANGGLDVTNPNDRALGIYNGAEVSTKPWVPANYQIIFDRGAGADKALGVRTRSGALGGDAYAGGFGILYEDDNHPLRAQALGREFGVGVVGRHKAAINFSAGATYVAPAI
ncbi:MAG: hypothetical protein M3440_05505, partial [Chloroflexota bacterium]|nr:hypothetical protein [Chloroflexota bacterium]